jgi:RNA polymerase sigma-70 factor (ECF subfamily)
MTTGMTKGGATGRDFQLQEQLLAQIPLLRALALMLSGDKKHADELTRTTVVSVLSDGDKRKTSFPSEQSFKVWLVKKLREAFNRNPVSITPKMGAAPEIPPAAGEGPFDYAHFRRAFWQLRPDQREVLILTGAGGFSAEEVAEIRQCNVAAAKAQATRARNLLKKILEREARAERRRGGAGAGPNDPAHR